MINQGTNLLEAIVEVVEVICLFEVVEVACLFEVVICLFEVLEVVCRFEVVEVTCISAEYSYYRRWSSYYTGQATIELCRLFR
jgi:hypothetical protein